MAKNIFHTDEIVAHFPGIDTAVARAFARAASHDDHAADAASVMGQDEWSDEDVADVAWQWAHSVAADAAHQAHQAIPSAQHGTDGHTHSEIFRAPLTGGGVIVWAADDSREGDPLPAVTWTVYADHDLCDISHQDYWVASALRVEPSAATLVEALRASARDANVRIAS